MRSNSFVTVLYRQIPYLLLILTGNFIYTLAIAMFILPNNLITGGTTGLALVVNRQFGIPISSFVLLFNLVMFVFGFLFLGKKFAFTTLVSTFFYPVALELTQHIKGIDTFTNNPMLATVFAGLFIGFGIGIVIRVGASTGGMDIPPLILNKKFRIPVSVSLYAMDVTVLILQMLFSNKEQILYGILLVLIYTTVLDRVLLIGSSKMQVKIISDEFEDINERIISQLDRGATLIHAETGFHGKDTKLVLTVVSNRELPKLNQMVYSIDPNAFIIIHKVNEVKGRGFTQDKKYLNS